MTDPDGDSDLHLRAVADVEEQMADLGTRIRESMRDSAAAVDPALTPFGLKVVRLVARHGPVHAGRVADLLFVERSAVSRQVRQLEELGLIEVTPDPEDGRARFLAVTPHAVERIEAVGLTGRTVLRSALVSWSTEDLQQLSEYILRLSRPE
jgi:DNA-binding MarR family transcriptional regulator